MYIRDARFSVVDVETTGLNLLRDEIISIAIIPMKGTKILAGDSFHTYIKPSSFDIKSMRIHGISPQALSDAPTFESIAEKIKDMLGDSIIVGHVVEIDLDFLKKSFKNAGIKFDNNAIDIAILEKWLGERLGDRRTDLSLDSLIKVYNLSSRFRHSAIADAFLTAQIFQIQLLKLLKYGMTSVERILSALESARMSRIDFIF